MIIVHHLKRINPNTQLHLLMFASGLQRPEDVFLEDPRAMGRAGHLRRCLKDQSPLQGERHPPRSGGPTGVALASFPPATPRDAPAA